ncbi:MAG: hypothetical protein WCZ28_12180 [Burkholderiaceae bacterium]
MDLLSSPQLLEIDSLSAEEWVEFAYSHPWHDGLPVVPPTEQAVARFLETCPPGLAPFDPVPPRQAVPTLESLAANSVMAGCKPEYFPVVLAALRAVLMEQYNLHGTLATTHSCAPMIMVNGPVRQRLGIACGANCLGQGFRANATIGRALQLILLNIGGARPGDMDRATQGSPAKYTYCFGENEEESPWDPYHVRLGFAPDESVVTLMSAEGPHNINDHASVTGEGILTTMASVIAQSGANTIYGAGPSLLLVGPEHAATLKRDNWTVEKIREFLFRKARVPEANVSPANRASYAETDRVPLEGGYTYGPSPESLHIAVAGGPGKHSAWIPSFGYTDVASCRIGTPAR